LQCRHRASERGESTRTLSFDEGFEGFAKQRSFLGNAGKFLGGADEVVIQSNGGSHHNSSASIIASNDAIIGASSGNSS
jgi:hypothetical protein